MKYILILIFIFSFSFSDEIKRVDSIVKDITELKQQHKICQKKLHKYSDKNEKYRRKLKELKNEISKYKKLLKDKNKEIKKLKISKDGICKQKKFDKPNEFPNLILKPQYTKYNIITTKPATYRLKSNTNIYNKINGKPIKSWKEGVSFTTNIKATLQKKDSWLKITGFFIDGTWVKSQSQMWIKTKYTKKR